MLAGILMVLPSFAFATETPCSVINHINKKVTTLENAMASGSVDEMRKAASATGVKVSGGASKASKTVLGIAIRSYEGSLQTLLYGAHAACHAEQTKREAERVAEFAKRQAEAAKRRAEELAHQVKRHICHKHTFLGSIPYPC
jgi:hypothetical protein